MSNTINKIYSPRGDMLVSRMFEASSAYRDAIMAIEDAAACEDWATVRHLARQAKRAKSIGAACARILRKLQRS